MNLFREKIDSGVTEDPKGGSYERLKNLIWDSSHLKKSIMTIPYNASHRKKRDALRDKLVISERTRDKDEDKDITLYKDEVGNKTEMNNKDITLLITCLDRIIKNDF